MNTRAEQNDERFARTRANDYIAKLSITDDEKEELARLTLRFTKATFALKEKEFKIELATVLKSVNRFIE